MNQRLASGVGIASVLVIVLVGFILSWHYYGRMDPYGSLLPYNETSAAVPIQLENVQVKTRSAGSLLWKTSAASVEISADRRTVAIDHLSDGGLFKNNTPVLHFAARHIVYNLGIFSQDSLVKIDGGVDIWSSGSGQIPMPNVHFTTPVITWDRQTGLLSCQQPVQFLADGLGAGTAVGVSLDTIKNLFSFQSLAVTADPAALGQTTNQSNSAVATPVTGQASDNLVTYAATQSGYWDENNRVLTLNGIVTFHQGNATVQMDGATYDRKTNTATSASPVKITDTDTSVNGDHGTINFTSHMAVLSGHVTMLLLPKPEDTVKEQEAKKPTTILCDEVVYDYRAKQAHTTGSVVIRQTGRTVTADDGKYDVKLRVVSLVGNVIGKSTDGKVIKAPFAKVSVDPKDEWIQLNGPVTGQLPLADEDNPIPNNSSVQGQTSAAQQTR